MSAEGLHTATLSRHRFDCVWLGLFCTAFIVGYLTNAANVQSQAVRDALPGCDAMDDAALAAALAASLGSALPLPQRWVQRLWGAVMAPSGTLQRLPALAAHRLLVRGDPVLAIFLALAATGLLLVTVGKRWYLSSRHHRTALLTTQRLFLSSVTLTRVALVLPQAAAAVAAAAAAASAIDGGEGVMLRFHSAESHLHAHVSVKYGGMHVHLLVATLTLCYGLPLWSNLLYAVAFVWNHAAAARIVGACYAEPPPATPAGLAALAPCVASPRHWAPGGAADAAKWAVMLAAVALAHVWEQLRLRRRWQAAAAADRAVVESSACAPTAPPAKPGSSALGDRAVATQGTPELARATSAGVPRTLAAAVAAAPKRSAPPVKYVSPMRLATVGFKVVVPATAPAGQAYAVAEARVRAAAALALARVSEERHLCLVSTSTTTFPGCVHLVLGLQLPEEDAAADASWQQRLHEVLQELLPTGASVAVSTADAGAGAAAAGDVESAYIEPPALPIHEADGDADAGEAAGRLQLCLPAWLVARMGEGCGVRVVAALERGQGPAAVLLDTVFAAADVVEDAPDDAPSRGGHLRLQLPPMPDAQEGAGATATAAMQRGALVLVHVLLLQPPAAPDPGARAQEVLLSQLQVPLLRAEATAELAALRAAMAGGEGSWPGDAYAAGFGDVALDLALVLRDAGATAAHAETLAALRSLMRLLSGQPGGMPACMRLVAEAAMRHGLHAKMLQAALAAAAVAAQHEDGGDECEGADAPAHREGRELAPSTSSDMASEATEAAALHNACLTAKSCDVHGTDGEAAAGDRGAAAPPPVRRRSPGVAALVGYASPAEEREYLRWKAERCLLWDQRSVFLRVIAPVCFLAQCQADVMRTASGPLVATAGCLYCALLLAPCAAVLAAPRAYVRRRDAWEGGVRVATAALGVAIGAAGCAVPAARVATARFYERPVRLMIFVHVCFPMLLHISLPAHAAGMLARVAFDATAVAVAPLPASLMLVSLACAAVGALGVWATDRRFRARFVAERRVDAVTA